MKKIILLLVLLSLIYTVYADCGDGSYEYPEEQCDDGNNLDGDGCSAICEKECFDTDDPNEEMEAPQQIKENFGYNPYEKGIVSYFANQPHQMEDVCHPSPAMSHILQERFCRVGTNGWSVETIPVPCDFGCYEGVCLEEPQNDIPEFTIVGAMLVLGLAGLVIVRKRQ